MATITINKANFFHNLRLIEQKCSSKTAIAIVLKDNAYGHGLKLMAELSSEYGIGKAVVRDVTEAKEIEGYFDEIIILGGEVEVYPKFSYAVNELATLKTLPKGLRVELKVDTGMHRNGLTLDVLEEALHCVKERELQLIGVMTHYACADELGSELFFQQKNFETVKSIVKQYYQNVRFHSYNSATLLRMNAMEEDLVRVGIAAYGYSELPACFHDTMLKPVLTLYANRVSTKVLSKGDRVGYGGEYIAKEKMKVSTYDLGYGDGWRRGDTNTPHVTAEGLPILGRVSMDFITLASTKERVCIMANAKESAHSFSTISYELLTQLMPTIGREVV